MIKCGDKLFQKYGKKYIYVHEIKIKVIKNYERKNQRAIENN